MLKEERELRGFVLPSINPGQDRNTYFRYHVSRKIIALVRATYEDAINEMVGVAMRNRVSDDRTSELLEEIAAAIRERGKR